MELEPLFFNILLVVLVLSLLTNVYGSLYVCVQYLSRTKEGARYPGAEVPSMGAGN